MPDARSQRVADLAAGVSSAAVLITRKGPAMPIRSRNTLTRLRGPG